MALGPASLHSPFSANFLVATLVQTARTPVRPIAFDCFFKGVIVLAVFLKFFKLKGEPILVGDKKTMTDGMNDDVYLFVFSLSFGVFCSGSLLKNQSCLRARMKACHSI